MLSWVQLNQQQVVQQFGELHNELLMGAVRWTAPITEHSKWHAIPKIHYSDDPKGLGLVGLGFR